MLRMMVNVQLNQLGYIPSICSAIIKMVQTGRMMTNCQVQYLRSFRVWWSSRTVWGCSLWNHYISIILNRLKQKWTQEIGSTMLSRKEKLTIVQNVFRSDMFQHISSENNILINTSIKGMICFSPFLTEIWISLWWSNYDTILKT